MVQYTVGRGRLKFFSQIHPDQQNLIPSKISRYTVIYIRFHLSVRPCVSNGKRLHFQEMDLTLRSSLPQSGLAERLAKILYIFVVAWVYANAISSEKAIPPSLL